MLFVFAIVLSLAVLGITTVLGPKNPLASKLSTYECGITPEGSARQPFKTGFYLIAVLFLLFDVEAAFFFPWALVYKDSLKTDGSLLVAMLAYLVFLVIGLIYVFRKNVLRLRT